MINKHAKAIPGRSAINGMYSRYVKSAVKRNLVFSLTVDEFRGFVSGNCYYCGIGPMPRKVGHATTGCVVNGIDRKEPSIGYIPSNCVPCCSQCNFAKGSMTFDQFLGWLSRIVNFRCNTIISYMGDRV